MIIAITRADGGVSIMRTNSDLDDYGQQVRDDLVAFELSRWQQSSPGQYVSHREIAASDLPSDRTYRNAWTDDGKTVTHDMVKARSLHRDLMRAARIPRFAVLDVAYLRADEKGDADGKAAVAAQRQALRDVTAIAAIDSAQTLEELAQVWPDVLRAG